MFDTVKVEICVEGDEQGMRQKMRMRLAEPFVEGVSELISLKRKSSEEQSSDDNDLKQKKVKK